MDHIGGCRTGFFHECGLSYCSLDGMHQSHWNAHSRPRNRLRPPGVGAYDHNAFLWGPQLVKPNLTTKTLLARGFTLAGSWELNSASDLAHRIDLPKTSGVYAFAIDGVVQYVGLASKSLAQRLGFYRTPGATQRTNIRLNEIIRGHLEKGTLVEIFLAHPPDHDWHGFTIKGPEGLEAGVIAEFDLPWNVRGAVGRRPALPQSSGSGQRQSGRGRRILEAIEKSPGLTGGEIARVIYGPKGQQPQINTLLHSLIEGGFVERRRDPGSSSYRYYVCASG
jgi:hypothetical protein